MFSIITFPSDFASSTLSVAGTIASDFAIPLYLILGVVLGLLAVSFIIRAIHPR